jgi:hypothetical protein
VPPVPIRWLLVRDPTGELEPQAFLATDLNARPGDILAWLCVQRRLACSAGIKPAGVKVRAP